MNALRFKSTSALASMISAQQISARDLLETYIKAMTRHNPRLNAIVAADLDAARTHADAADEALARGENWGALHGVPFTIKDAFETKSLVTTGGAPEWRKHVPDRDADAVARLRQAGAVIFGKTNVPLYSGDWQSFNEFYGRTNNPWDLEKTPGGSSGGAVAALAAGMTGGDIGSDIGGSIRLPAHFTGLFGHKPSFGLVSPRGHIPGPPGRLSTGDLSVAGPLGRSAADLDLVLSVLVAPRPEDRATRLELPEPRFSKPQDLRVAVCADDPFCPVSNATTKAVIAAARTLEGAGAHVVFDARPKIDFTDLLELHLVLMTALISTGFPKSVRKWLTAHASTVSDDDRDMLSFQARGAALTYSDAMVLWEKREQARARWADFFENFDVFLCPAGPVGAINHDTARSIPDRRIMVDGKERGYMDLLPWMALATPTYLPASVAPAGVDDSGMPVGVQIVGPFQEDRTTIAVAALLEKTHKNFVAPPSFS